MSLHEKTRQREPERMSDWDFRGMVLLFNVSDFFYRYIDKRVKDFGIRAGMTVVDYGCGPGRYTLRFSRLVGPAGRVYAVDIHELAIEAVKRKMERHGLHNVVPLLASGYHSGVPGAVSDVVCAIDMFFTIRQPSEFLAELRRIAKTDGTLVIDDGHQPRSVTKQSIVGSGFWTIAEETRDHLNCRPL